MKPILTDFWTETKGMTGQNNKKGTCFERGQLEKN
jgi:hypothetical protein